jgi:hypothetical protein
MKFAVQVSGKKFPVVVMKEPNNISALSNFTLEGRTYKGLPEQFNGLRLDKTKNRYTAVSIVVTESIKPISSENTVIEEEEESTEIIIEKLTIEEHIESKDIIVEETSIVEETIIENEAQEIEEEPEIDDSEVEDTEEKKRLFLEEVEAEAQKLKRESDREVAKINGNGFRKLKFQSRLHDIFPDNISYGEGLYEKQKTVWIRLHGSEHLKMAHDMGTRCDSLYIQERAAKELSDWKLHDLLVCYEIDSPDFGILTFLKNFKKIHHNILDPFRSKISIATTDDNPDENDPVVVITDFLGYCDLSIPLVNLVDTYGDRC